MGATVLLRAGLFIEVALHGTLAASTSPWPVAVVIVVFSVHAVVWGTVVTTIRQRTVPGPLYGRATSVYAIIDVSGTALGSLLGGFLAQQFGLVAVFWTAAAAMTVISLTAWRPLALASPVFRND